MKTIFFTIVIVLSQLFYSQTATTPSTGDGSSGDPYQIATLENLFWIYNNTALWSLHFIQTADIDASETSTWYSNAGWPVIGNSSTSFTGSYNGQGFKIDDLFINRNTDDKGLFGRLNGATIQNFGLTNVNITAPSYVGGLAGRIYGNSTITNCYVTGSVSGYTSDGYSNVGGIVGESGTSIIRNCYASVTVNGRTKVGGLVGFLVNTTIANSYSTDNVSGTSQSIGGIAGSIYPSGKIDSSYSNANVSGYSQVGGAVGNMNGGGCEVYRSYASGNVSSTNGSAGGFVGYMWDSGEIISNCYSFGNVSRTSGSSESYGGFGGYFQAGTINNCYSTGGVNFGSSKGFLGGSSVSTYSANFFDSQASGQTSGTGATAKTTTEMKTNTTFLNAGWSSSVWFMDEGLNNGYPYLSWQNPGGTPLPVELTSFSVKAINGNVLLNWVTATEVNNYGFEVEMKVSSPQSSIGSQTQNTWEKIGFVQGNGNSNSQKEYSFTDKNPSNGIIKYRLKQIDNDGRFSYSSEVEVNIESIPTEFALYQNYPNPFNPTTRIEYQLPNDAKVMIELYSITGERVGLLVNEEQQAGYYAIDVNVVTLHLASGVYIYRMIANDNLKPDSFIQLRKMVLIK